MSMTESRREIPQEKDYALEEVARWKRDSYKFGEIVERLIEIEQPELDPESDEFQDLFEAQKKTLEIISAEELLLRIRGAINRLVEAKRFRAASKFARFTLIPGEQEKVDEGWLAESYQKFKVASPEDRTALARKLLEGFSPIGDLRRDARKIEIESAQNLDLMIVEYKKNRVEDRLIAFASFVYGLERMRSAWKLDPDLLTLPNTDLTLIRGDAVEAVRQTLKKKDAVAARKLFDEYQSQHLIELDTDVALSEELTS